MARTVASELRDLKGRVDGLADDVGAIKADFAEFKALPMKAARWIAITIAGAALSVLTQNYVLHQQTTAAAQVAATQATQANAKATTLLTR